MRGAEQIQEFRGMFMSHRLKQELVSHTRHIQETFLVLAFYVETKAKSEESEMPTVGEYLGSRCHLLVLVQCGL